MTAFSTIDPEIDVADDFWTATGLDRSTNDRFVRRLRLAPNEVIEVHPLASAGAPIGLDQVDDRFRRVLARRRSRRAFDDRPLTARQLARLLGAIGEVDGRRLVPSAGGLDAVSAFVLARAVEGPAAGVVARFDPAAHRLLPVTRVPGDDELAAWCNLDPDVPSSLPALVVVLVADLRPIRRKYGARGDRFALVETGCALQNLELRAAKDRLAAHQLGGLREELRPVLGLPDPDVRITGALAVGRPG